MHAGQLIAAAQGLGALSRDPGRALVRPGGHRLRPMRQLALPTAAVVAATALTTAFPSPLTARLLVAAIG